MPLSWDTIQANAIEFSKRWETGAREKQEAQSFVRAFLAVFDVDTAIIDNGFEAPVKIGGQGHSKYIDYLWEDTRGGICDFHGLYVISNKEKLYFRAHIDYHFYRKK